MLGVAKAYVTRVGEGPFPTEIEGEQRSASASSAPSTATTTGRARRCGWLDLVALRYAVRVNGMTSLALTKLDVLSAFDEIPVCTRYRLPDGTETDEFPAHQSDFHHARPVYETLAGWKASLEEAESLADLPDDAGTFVSFVEEQLGVEVSLISVGAGASASSPRAGSPAWPDQRRAATRTRPCPGSSSTRPRGRRAPLLRRPLGLPELEKPPALAADGAWFALANGALNVGMTEAFVPAARPPRPPGRKR